MKFFKIITELGKKVFLCVFIITLKKYYIRYSIFHVALTIKISLMYVIGNELIIHMKRNNDKI